MSLSQPWTKGVADDVLRSELSRLRAENQSLVEELAQTQSDKEFVWSLWKRLQVASPDITQAIGAVVQREKEKSELKDRKVLEILQSKDDKIYDLQQTISSQSKEISDLLASKTIAKNEVVSHKDESQRLQDKVEMLSEKIKSMEKHEKNMNELHQQVVQGFQKDKKELQENVDEYRGKLEGIMMDKDNLTSDSSRLNTRIEVLEMDLAETGKKYEELREEHEEAKGLLKKYEKELSQSQQDHKHKEQELESVRQELSDLWQSHHQTVSHAGQQADLIKQLQSLQKDTQQIMRNQEDAYSIETASIQNLVDDLKIRYTALETDKVQLEQELEQQNEVVASMQQQLETARAAPAELSSTDKMARAMWPQLDAEQEIQDLKNEIMDLKSQLSTKNKIIDRLEGFDEYPKDDTIPLLYEPLSSTPKRGRVRRARSLSPRHAADDQSNDKTRRTEQKVQRKLEENRKILKLKHEELEEVKKAHKQRLTRLQALQKEYRLLKQQHKVLQEEHQGKPPKKTRLPKPNPKALQKEDTDAAWSELTQLRKEHRRLQVEKMNIEEELDLLRVQAKEDAASIYELKSCLESEREEAQFMLEQQANLMEQQKQDADVKQQVMKLQEQVDMKVSQVQKLTAGLDRMTAGQDELTQEKQKLRSELRKTQQVVTEKRIEIADLKKRINRLERDLKKKKQKALTTSIGGQYRMLVNKSSEHTERYGRDNSDQEAWEDVEDSETVGDTTGTCNTTETVNTTTSLGQCIVSTAKGNGGSPSPRQAEAEQAHIQRLASKERERRTRQDSRHHPSIHTDQLVTRSIATSPIPFESLDIQNRKERSSMSSGRSSSLRQRISSLQQRVRILNAYKATSTKTITKQKEMVTRLQSDLTTSNQRLQSTRLMLQRLTAELEHLREEKDAIEQQLDETRTTDTLSTQTDICQHTQEEWANIQARLKISTTEVTKQLSVIKQLRESNASLQDKVASLQDRLNHAERDLAQKRTLVEDFKLKVKMANENASTESAALGDLENKTKELTDSNNRLKTQMDSLKQQLQTLNREKRDQEDKVISLSEELDKKMKQISNLQRKCSKLQSSMAEVEQEAQNKMHNIADQSEAALDAAHSKLTVTTEQLQEYEKFVKTFAHEILSSVQQFRNLIQQRASARKAQQEKKSLPSLAKAGSVAKEILNLSQSEFDDIMSVTDGDQGKQYLQTQEEMRKDRKWLHRCAKLIANKGEFSLNLVDLLMEKVEERGLLSSQLSQI